MRRKCLCMRPEKKSFTKTSKNRGVETSAGEGECIQRSVESKYRASERASEREKLDPPGSPVPLILVNEHAPGLRVASAASALVDKASQLIASADCCLAQSCKVLGVLFCNLHLVDDSDDFAFLLFIQCRSPQLLFHHYLVQSILRCARKVRARRINLYSTKHEQTHSAEETHCGAEPPSPTSANRHMHARTHTHANARTRAHAHAHTCTHMQPRHFPARLGDMYRQ